MASSSLLQGLEHRPTPDDLAARGIIVSLPSTMDPSLQQAAKSLERHMTADQISKQLAARPTTQELVMEGVLHLNLASVAPALHGKVLALENERRKDGLKNALQARPELGELQQQHKVVVVSPGGLSPSLASAAVELEFHLKADKIARHLRDRAATKEKLERNGILSPWFA